MIRFVACEIHLLNNNFSPFYVFFFWVVPRQLTFFFFILSFVVLNPVFSNSVDIFSLGCKFITLLFKNHFLYIFISFWILANAAEFIKWMSAVLKASWKWLNQVPVKILNILIKCQMFQMYDESINSLWK